MREYIQKQIDRLKQRIAAEETPPAMKRKLSLRLRQWQSRLRQIMRKDG